MMTGCECRGKTPPRRIVLTGGPGAGKTAVLELLRHSLCEHVAIVPEAAGVIFGGGFPRRPNEVVRSSAQRAIFQVQIGLEAAAEADGAGVMLCDRGIVDGRAYWPGPKDFFEEMGLARDEILRRYYAVIHLRVPAADGGYGHQNPLRVESAVEARKIDDLIFQAWDGHPRRHVVDPTPDFVEKARRALFFLHEELPECCRVHTTQAVEIMKEPADVHAA